MKVFSITEGRKMLGELVNLAKYQKRVIALGKSGKVDVLLISFPEGIDDVSITEINAASKSFDFLKDEPDLYSVKDLKRRYD